MRVLLLVLLLAACPSGICYRDSECPDAGGWCEVPSLSCSRPFVPACREGTCVMVCPCRP